MTTSRTRLSPDARRTQLLEIGSRLFADRPYDDVWIDEVADTAGVSRGLMYHYFSSKRDFFAAVVRVESDRLVEVTTPDASLPLAEQVSAGLAAYIQYVSDHEHGVRAVNRGSMSGDDEIQGIVTAELAVQYRRIMAAIGSDDAADEVTSTAVRGWISLVRAVCLDWLDRRSITDTELHDLCMRALYGLLSERIDTVTE